MYGRKQIYTNYNEITRENVIEVLRSAVLTHVQNADRINYLIRYEEGEQPLQRVKTYRPDIDVQCNDNLANEIVEFKQSFFWGNPITLTQRGEKDSGNKEEAEAIALLNECYESENIRKKTQELARFIEIGGIGFTYVDINTDWEEGESYFKVETLDPRTAFVVKYAGVGHKPLMGVTFRRDGMGNTYYTCFTKNERFEIINATKVNDDETVDDWFEAPRSGERNPLGVVPIIEWERSTDRMGCFERQIPEMDNLNILVSDFTNSVDQNTQAIWHGNDIEFPEDENGNIQEPKTNDWVLTKTSANGKTPTINALAVQYDYHGMLNNILARRGLILQKCNVPQRNDNSGGSTGIAMSDATGWSSAEASANKEQMIIESCKMEEVKVVLKALQKSSDIEQDNPMLNLKVIDIQPSIKRQKNHELNVKINAFATGVSHGLDYKSLIRTINLFEDPLQVIQDSQETMEKYIAKEFGENQINNTDKSVNADRTLQDESDQIENSPTLDGSNKEK